MAQEVARLAPPSRPSDVDPSEGRGVPLAEEAPAIRAARVYFGRDPLGGSLSTIEPWGPDEKPVFEPDDDQIIDQVSVNVLGAAAHVFLFKAAHAV